MKLSITSKLIVGALLAAGCPSGVLAGSGDTEGSSVMFDYFEYRGDDDYYKENPLPDASSFYNPILPGWYSDPSICRAGDDYYMVTSTFSFFPGVPLFHSKDLLNWKLVNYILDRPSQLPLDGQHVSGGIFAPAISYNPHKQLLREDERPARPVVGADTPARRGRNRPFVLLRR